MLGVTRKGWEHSMRSRLGKEGGLGGGRFGTYIEVWRLFLRNVPGCCHIKGGIS